MMSYYLVMQTQAFLKGYSKQSNQFVGGLTAVSLTPQTNLVVISMLLHLILFLAPNRNIDILPNGSGVVNLDGDGSSGGVSISDGLIDIRTGTGNVSKVKFYCESSNAHAQTLQAQPHSGSSSAVLTLPVATGTLISSGDTGTLPLVAIDIDGGSDIGGALSTSDLIIVDDGGEWDKQKGCTIKISDTD